MTILSLLHKLIYGLRLAILGIALLAPVTSRADIIPYEVLAKMKLPGGTKWDYLAFDAPGHRLFVTRGDQVDVVDPDTLTVKATIPDVAGLHGVALAPDLGKGYISNGKTAAVTVFDMKSLKILNKISAEDDADSIVYDAATSRVFTANGDSGSLAVIDAKTDRNIGSIRLTGKPEFAVVDGKGRLFVNIEDKSHLDVIDTKTLKLLASYDLSAACKNPAGLAIDVRRERLFSGCRGQTMAVTDGDDGKILAAPPIGKMSDAVAFDAKRNLAFSSNGDGTLTVIGSDGPDGYKVEQSVQTMPAARTMALDPRSHQIYLVTAEIDHLDAPSPAKPHPRPQFKTGSFQILVVGPPPDQ